MAVAAGPDPTCGGRGGARTAGGGFWSGVLEALLVPLAFVLLGLSWWGVVEGARPAPSPYADPMGRGRVPAETWLIDGFNVVQVALLGGRDRSGWWGAPQRAELLSRAEAFEDPDASVVVVFDGARDVEPDGRPGRVQPVFAPSADEWLLDRVRRAEDPGALVVVTADRRLAGRARHHGARIVSPGAFLARCGRSATAGAALDG